MEVRAAALAALIACLGGCARDRNQLVPQIAVLRFENLTADPSLDWMGRGFSEIISSELAGSRLGYVLQFHALHSFDRTLGVRTVGPGISSERAGALVAGANTIVYGGFSVVDGALRATATEENLLTHKMERVVSATGPVNNGLLPVAEELARQLGETHPFGTRNPAALHAFAAALEAPDPAAALRGFADAAAADPGFGRAYVFWLQAALASRNGAEAQLALAQARAHQANFGAIDRATLDLDAAALGGNYPAQIDALRALTRADPANPDHHRALAEGLMSLRKYDEAIPEFRRGLSVRPDDAVALNSLGYAAALSGDLPTAIRVLRGYEQIRPKEPNPLDSLGDVHFMLGHFAEAEQFYLAAQSRRLGFANGGDLWKAAQARLMTGDVQAAGVLFSRFLAGRQEAHDPNAPYVAATWQWETGARREAIAALDRVARADEAGPLREVASRADAQAAIWLLDLGDRAGAAAQARKALAEANAGSAPLAALAAFLAEPAAFPAPSQAPLSDYAHAYAMLYGKQFQAAAEMLQAIYNRPTGEPDDGLAVMLAWAYEETGQWQRAEPLLRLTPLPQANGLPVFASLYFPRLFFLRGAVLDRNGRHEEAARNFEMFRKLSGRPAGGAGS